MDSNKILEFERLMNRFQNDCFAMNDVQFHRRPFADYEFASRHFLKSRDELFTFVMTLMQ